MRQTSIFKAILSVNFLHSCACEHDHNFLVTFDKDIRSVFGVRNHRAKASSVPLVKPLHKESKKAVKEVSDKKVVKDLSVNEFDHLDFDRAEKDIFMSVENAEKAVLKAASNLIHDEVDVLFGADHGSSIHRSKVVNVQKKKTKNQTRTKSNRRSAMKDEKKDSVEQDSLFPGIDAISDCIFE